MRRMKGECPTSHFSQKSRGGRRGRKEAVREEGNGLATNCTITTFGKRKNHLVLFLRTTCFPTSAANVVIQWQRGKACPRGPHSQWAAGRAQNTVAKLEAGGWWGKGCPATHSSPDPLTCLQAVLLASTHESNGTASVTIRSPALPKGNSVDYSLE
jgi:hypothetical protein